MKKDNKDNNNKNNIKNTNDSLKLNRFKRVQSTGIALIIALLVLVAAIPFNLIAGRLNMDFDMTPNSLYSLTETSVNIAKSLHNTVDVYIIFNSNNISDLSGGKPLNTLDDFSKISGLEPMYYSLSQYDSFDKINVTVVNLSTEKGIKIMSDLQLEESLANSLSGDKVNFLVKSGSIVKKVDGSTMFLSESSSESQTVTITGFTGENVLTSTINYVDKLAIVDKQPVNYFLTGHGEKSIDKDYSSIVSRIRQEGYKVAELNLSEMGKVPDDAQLIIVAGPTKDITKEERDMINEFLDNGGSITFLMSPNEEKKEYTYISDIMSKYAIAMNYDRVYDKEYMAEDDQYIFEAKMIGATSESAVDLTSPIINLNLPTFVSNSRSFYSVYSEDYNVNLIVKPLIQAYDSAVGEPYGGTNPDPDPTEGGMYLSYYAMDKSRNNSKILVLGDAEFIDNKLINADYLYNITMQHMFLNSVSWMNDADMDLNIPVKKQTNDKIIVSEDTTKVEESVNNLLILFYAIPVVVAGIGVLIWSRRRVS